MIGIPATAHPEGAFMAALWRVLEISLGILCTGTVSAIFLPQTSGAALRNTLYGRFRDFAGFAAEACRAASTASASASSARASSPSPWAWKTCAAPLLSKIRTCACAAAG